MTKPVRIILKTLISLSAIYAWMAASTYVGFHTLMSAEPSMTSRAYIGLFIIFGSLIIIAVLLYILWRHWGRQISSKSTGKTVE